MAGIREEVRIGSTLMFLVAWPRLTCSRPLLTLTLLSNIYEITSDNVAGSFTHRLPGPYMRGISGPMPINWGKLNQEVWALSTVNQTPLHSSSGLPQTPLNRRANQTCDKGNGGAFCSFRTCWYNHACAKCLSPQHLLILGEPRPLLPLPQRGSIKTRKA